MEEAIANENAWRASESARGRPVGSSAPQKAPSKGSVLVTANEADGSEAPQAISFAQAKDNEMTNVEDFKAWSELSWKASEAGGAHNLSPADFEELARVDWICMSSQGMLPHDLSNYMTGDDGDTAGLQ